MVALQTHPGNRVHLMLVSPFIVETGEFLCFDIFSKIISLPGMVKRPRIRFPNLLGTVTTASAAE